MKVNTLAVFAALLSSISVTAAFFTYDDCDDTCKKNFVSCTISEETKRYFCEPVLLEGCLFGGNYLGTCTERTRRGRITALGCIELRRQKQHALLAWLLA